jgi:hypothetical protein
MKYSNQVVGNMGMYYICYELSRRGWNALPTSRNAKGIDIVIYNNNASVRHTIQVKSLSKRVPVPLGNNLFHLFADFIIICANLVKLPELYIAHVKEIRNLIHEGKKDGRLSYWLQPKDYIQFRDNWDIIGEGME